MYEVLSFVVNSHQPWIIIVDDPKYDIDLSLSLSLITIVQCKLSVSVDCGLKSLHAPYLTAHWYLTVRYQWYLIAYWYRQRM